MATAYSVQSGLVCVATIFSRPELACFVASLQAEGISASIVGDHYGSINPITVALGGYHVMVPAEELDDAIAIIQERGFDSPEKVFPPGLRTRIWMTFLVGVMMIALTPLPIAGRSEYARRPASVELS